MRAPVKGLSRPLQVGAFVFLALMIVVAFSLRITDSPLFRPGTELIAYFDDATGIFINSKVKMAGIDIGVIQSIKLDKGKARIALIIDRGIEIPENARIVPRPLGILGDKYLDIVLPGTDEKTASPEGAKKEGVSPLKNGHGTESDSRAPSSIWSWFISDSHATDTYPDNQTQGEPKELPKTTPLKGGQVIKSVNSSATLDDVTRQLGAIATDLKSISSALKQVVTGKEHIDSPVGRTLRNVELLTGNLNSMIQENRKDVRASVQATAKVTQKLNNTLDSFDESHIRADLRNLSNSAANFGKTLQHFESVAAKVDNGEGTLGKLINDPAMANEINRTLQVVNDTLGKAQRTEIIVDMTPEYAFKSKQTKTYVGVMLKPREDSGYLAELVVDPNGTKQTVITTQKVNGGPSTVTETITNDRSAFRLSLQFYKRLYQIAFRIGLFETTGGVASDLFFLHDHVKLTAEIFGFGERDTPDLKLTAKFRFFNYFYASVGVDDLIRKVPAPESQRSLFAGLGVHFTDEDLKSLLVFSSVR